MLLVIDVPTLDQRKAANACIDAIETVAGYGKHEIHGLPPLYASRVVYREDPPGPQKILRPAQIHEQGFADCKSLIVYRLCDLRERCGEHAAVPRIIWLKTPRGFRAHAVIRRADKSIECPSTQLGM